jgi:hypothetical protein
MKFRMRDLLVLILIVSLLISLGIPLVQNYREQAAAKKSILGLKMMALALHSCNDIHRRLPPAFDSFSKISKPESLHVHLLPFVEQEDLYGDFVSSRLGREKAKVPEYYSPQDPAGFAGGVQNFAANLRIFSDQGFKTAWDKDLPPLAEVEPGTPKIPQTFIDGTSNTIVFVTKFSVCGEGGSHYAASPISPFAAFFGEKAAQVKANNKDIRATFQVNPFPSQCICRPAMAQGFRSTGIVVVLGDVSIRTVLPDVSTTTWNYALQPNDLNILGKPWE